MHRPNFGTSITLVISVMTLDDTVDVEPKNAPKSSVRPRITA
jgi:hypothetical protein